MQHQVTFDIDTNKLQSYSDEHLSSLWHIAQANPAPIDDARAGDLAETIGREIIRRWLRWAGAPLWNHQGRHHYSHALRQHCAWDGKEWHPNTPDAAPSPDAADTTEVQ